MNELRVLLLCGSRFALPALQELVFFNRLAAVAIPCHCREMLEDTGALLNGTGIPIISIEGKTCEAQLAAILEQYRINLGLVMTFSWKIPASVYRRPALGFYNVHPSPLPRYRGADPIFQQIKNREPFSGVTVHQLTESMDGGPIVIKELIPLRVEDTHGMLTTKLSVLAGSLLRTVVKLASLGLTIPLKVQKEEDATSFPKQGAADVTIDWERMGAADIIALMNACNPWNKGAVTRIGGKLVRFLQGEISAGDTTSLPPGTIIQRLRGGLLIAAAGQEVLRLDFISMDEGFFPASSLSYFDIKPGQYFETM